MSKAVITGIGLVTAAGFGKESFFKAIKEGKSCVSEPTLFDVSKYYCKQAGEVKEIEGKKNRMYYMLKFALDEALKDAGLSKEDLLTTSTELIVGTAHGPLSDWEHWMDTKEEVEFLALEDPVDRISKEIDIKNYKVVSTACTSSTIAAGIGLINIRNQKVNIVIVGGVDVLTEFVFAGFVSLRGLTHSVCRPFDRFRDGLVLGEGAGVIILENIMHAQKRNAKVYCELAGFSATSDAEHFTAPSFIGEGLYRAMKNALEDASLTPQDISYINTHGTGTIQNDRAECYAIKKLFNEYAYKIPISSIKPIIGHTSGACGVIEIALCSLCIKENFIPANLNFENPEKGFEFNFVSTGYEEKISSIISVNLAFGGNNACCILKRI